MPTYDYACAACGHRFERFEPISDDGLKACLKCGKKKARRLLGTGAGLIFKGSGFYTTDYKQKPASGENGGSSSSKETAKEPAKKEKKKEEKEPKK